LQVVVYAVTFFLIALGMKTIGRSPDAATPVPVAI